MAIKYLLIGIVHPGHQFKKTNMAPPLSSHFEKNFSFLHLNGMSAGQGRDLPQVRT